MIYIKGKFKDGSGVYYNMRNLVYMRKASVKSIVFDFGKEVWTKSYKTRFLRDLAFLWFRITL
jgi:hypothetical protein